MHYVLLHGFAGTGAVWDDCRSYWTDHQPVTIPLPGHGDRGSHGGRAVQAGWHANLALVSELIAAAGGRGLPVVGYSLGARLALGLLAEDLIPSAVLISVNPGLTDEPERQARRQSDAAWAQLLRAEGLDEFLARWQAQPLFASQDRAPDERRNRRQQARQRLDPEQLAQALEHMGLAEMPDYRNAIAARAERIALVVGADDAKFCQLADELHQRGTVTITRIPQCGHDPTLEQPQALAAVVTSALRRWR
jgi:2-succinyl-6-hydroxy-2,4-cyclohexadiene-1-carboxylate synthase